MRRLRRNSIACVALAAACRTPLPAPSHDTGIPAPPRSVLDTPVDFSGWRGTTLRSDRVSEVRIGFFGPVTRDQPVGGPAFQGALLAIEQVNASGGFEGVPLRLITRWDADPWRGGSKLMTKLVYEDSVWAVIGSIDGTATHIAEQIVTKAWLPLISPVSGDPTLTYIRIPWVFRLPPDDGRQATVIVRDGILAASLKDVGVVTSTDHDGRIFAGELLSRMQADNVPPMFHLEVPLAGMDIADVVQWISSFTPHAVVLRFPPSALLATLDQLQHAGFRTPLLIPWIPGLLPSDLRDRYSGDIMYVQPFSEAGNPAYAGFARLYRDRYSTEASPSAAYAYDAVCMLVRALQKSGLNRADLRDAIAGLTGFRGATGAIAWDNAGGNLAEPVIMVLRGTLGADAK